MVLFYEKTSIVHAACRVGEHRYFDAYGYCSVGDMQQRYRCTLREVPATESVVQQELGFEPRELSQACQALEILEQALLKEGVCLRA